jgi:hypothetical protein
MTDTFTDEFLENPYEDPASPFGTPEEKKARNKAANIAACGKRGSCTSGPSGELIRSVLTCKCYRECDNCRQMKYDDEVEPRLNYGQNHLNLGDKLRFDRITQDERGAYMKRLSRGDFDYYTFPLPDDEILVIHNDPDGAGDELWDFGYDDHDLYNEDNGFDINFYTVLKNVPEGKRITGNLGKKREEEKELEGNGGQRPEEEEEEIFSIKKPFLYKPGLNERDANLYYEQAIAKTLDIKVSNEIELQQAMFARINAMADLIGGDDVITGFTWGAVTAAEVALWNNNPNNFSKNVQITTNKDTISNYLDKNHKKSSFEAMKERAIEGDGMESERQKALLDYLEYHGT